MPVVLTGNTRGDNIASLGEARINMERVITHRVYGIDDV